MAGAANVHGPVPPYGTAIHDSIAEGDLPTMKQVSAEAETYLAEVSDALKTLKAEIAKAEGG